MILRDLRLSQFRTLRNFDAAGLSAGLTVFYAAGRQDSADWVESLRQILFGHSAPGAVDFRGRPTVGLSDREAEFVDGEACVEHSAGVLSLRRVPAEGRDRLQVTDAQGHSVSLPSGSPLARWVTRDVFQDVCTPGPQEAEQFETLLAACREAGGWQSAEAELRQAMAAVEQVRRDRDGNGLSGGLIHRISQLRCQQGELQSRIAVLRKPVPDFAERIEQLQSEQTSALEKIRCLEVRITELDADLLAVEAESVAEISETSPSAVPVGRSVQALTDSLEQWRAIRSLIRRECVAGLEDGSLRSQVDETVVGLRRTMGQLEQQLQQVTEPVVETTDGLESAENGVSSVQLMKDELLALQQRLEDYETQLKRRQSSRTAMLMKRSLQDVSDLVSLLESELNSAAPGESGLQVGGTGTAGSANGAFAERQAALQNEYSVCQQELVQNQHRLAEIESTIVRLQAENSVTLTLEQLDQMRANYAELETQVTLLEEQRRQLDAAEDTLLELIVRLQTRSASGLFDAASEYLRRMTAGEFSALAQDATGGLCVRLQFHTELIPVYALDQSLRWMCGLALRLALLVEQAEHAAAAPLILNHCVPQVDEPRLTAILKLLAEVAGRGQQIVLLTDAPGIERQACLKSADLRTFSPTVAPVAAVAPVPEPAAAEVAKAETPALQIHAWVEPEVVERDGETGHEAITTQQTSAVIADKTTNWLFYLEADYGVEELAGISLGELEALRTSGILTVEDLLTHTVPQLEEATRQRGFLVSVERLQSLRGQAELASRVPMLRRGDAALLFAAGILSADDLRRLRPETVYERVTEFQRSEAGLRYRRSGRLIDRQQALNWARFGQFSRTVAEVRESRSRFGVRTVPVTAAKLRVATESGGPAVRPATAAASTETGAGTVVTKKRRRRTPEDGAVQERRARRSARREQLSNQLRVDAEVTDVREAAAVERVGGMRFFLGRTSDVKSAPSIGPRTAELFHAAGVRTIEEFLSVPSERLAEKLGSKRISAALVRQWQTQAQLMCQIPELRSNDSQILVACGVSTPESLAGRTPEELLAKVLPFVDSGEGRRILRNGRKPDLAAVTEWIQWAANARPFRAA